MAYINILIVVYGQLSSALLMLIIWSICLPFLAITSWHVNLLLKAFFQKLWINLLLAQTAHAVNSTMILTLDTEGVDEEMELRAYEVLRKGFKYDASEEERFEKLLFKYPNRIQAKDRDIIISNHQLPMDWIYIWAWMAKLGREGTIKVILKRSLMNIPILGLVNSPPLSLRKCIF